MVNSNLGVWAEPQPKSNLVHFSLKIRHLVATILLIFLRVLPKIFLWPQYSGAPGARGPRFLPHWPFHFRLPVGKWKPRRL